MSTASVDWTAIAGIAGSLLGVGIGAFFTYRIQDRQLLHENATRFHEERLSVYAAFLGACSGAFSATVLGSYSHEHMQHLIDSYERLRLVASQHVVNSAADVHSVVYDAIAARPNNEDSGLHGRYNAAVVAMLRAARSELGVEPVQDRP